jgi:hypothetical protein
LSRAVHRHGGAFGPAVQFFDGGLGAAIVLGQKLWKIRRPDVHFRKIERYSGSAKVKLWIYGDAVRVALVLPQPCRGYIRPDGLMVPLSSWLPLLSNGYHAGQSVIDTRLSLAQIGEAHAYR